MSELALPLEATLDYTTSDDGIWIELAGKRRNLGFWPTLQEAYDAAHQLALQAARETGRS